MMPIKEFVFEIWKLRGLDPYSIEWAPHQSHIDKGQSWLIVYNRWIACGCPWPIEDIDYHKMSTNYPGPYPQNTTMHMIDSWAKDKGLGEKYQENKVIYFPQYWKEF